jgi:hypothetical protein
MSLLDAASVDASYARYVDSIDREGIRASGRAME